MGRREYTDRREFQQCRGYIRESAGAIFNYVGMWGAIFASVVVWQEIAKRSTASGKQPSLFKDLEDWKEYRLSARIHKYDIIFLNL